MIQLFPASTPATEDGTGTDDPPQIDARAAVVAEARPAPGGRPWVYTNMIASVDGGTAVDGTSGQLGGPGDKAMFAALRSVADIVLVGAATARQERYRPPVPSEEIQAERTARGQEPHPRLAIVSRSLDLDHDLPLFDGHRPLVLTGGGAAEDRLSSLESLAEVVVAGDDGVDLGPALAELADRGARTVLCEGGPSLNGQLIADDLVDEWNLSLSPRLLGADSSRAAVGPVADGPPHGMRLRRVWTDDDFLFCRWTRAGDDEG